MHSLFLLGIRGEQVKNTEQVGMGLLRVSGSQFCRSYRSLTHLWHSFFSVLITSPMRSFTMMGKLLLLLAAAGVGAHSSKAHQQQWVITGRISLQSSYSRLLHYSSGCFGLKWEKGVIHLGWTPGQLVPLSIFVKQWNRCCCPLGSGFVRHHCRGVCHWVGG